MPPHSHTLVEEGAAIVSFKLVRAGRLDEAGMTALLQVGGSSGGGLLACAAGHHLARPRRPNDTDCAARLLMQAPGKLGDPRISGTRNLQDNLSDLRAQVGAFAVDGHRGEGGREGRKEAGLAAS